MPGGENNQSEMQIAPNQQRYADLTQVRKSAIPFIATASGQRRKTLAAPSLAAAAGGGLVVQTDISQLLIVEDARYNAQNARN